MKVLAVVYPGMTLLDLVGPVQAWSFLPGYEVQCAWHRAGPVRSDCGLSVDATHSFKDAWTDPDVLLVGGGAKPHGTGRPDLADAETLAAARAAMRQAMTGTSA